MVPGISNEPNLEEKMTTVHEEQDAEETAPPVIFNQDDYGELARHVNPCLNPIPPNPPGLLRFDCTELGNPHQRTFVRNRPMDATRTQRNEGVANSVGVARERSRSGRFPDI